MELGLEVGGSVVIGLAVGFYLDRWLGTQPWMLLLFMALGFAAAMRSLIRFARRSQMQQDDAAPPREPGQDA